MILTSPEAYEPHAVAATKEWFAETNRSVWALGPLLPPAGSDAAIAGEEASSEDFGVIKKFMDNALALHGERSILYVRRIVFCNLTCI